ncbi:MAG TPA: hypothetical protein H9782_11885 [Candidatus Bariatricus faecipullorum]|nr:hypothetical protein [Candidatus Bariatricus faecipullorum]
MEKKYSIALTAAVLVCVALLSFAYRAEYRFQERQALEIQEKEQEAGSEEEALSTQGDAQKEEIFYLKELNGYVAVYQEDKTTIYEYTSIPAEELPEEVQKELVYGKRIESVEKLYGFLENYSS